MFTCHFAFDGRLQAMTHTYRLGSPAVEGNDESRSYKFF